MSPDIKTDPSGPESFPPVNLDQPLEMVMDYISEPVTDPNFELSRPKQLQLDRFRPRDDDSPAYANHMAIQWIWLHPDSLKEPVKSNISTPLSFASNVIREGAKFLPTVNPSEFNTFDEFTEAIIGELKNRYRQAAVFERFDNLMQTVSTPENLTVATKIYTDLMTNSQEFKFPDSDGPMTPRHFTIRALQQAGKICTDPEDGTASTLDIVAVMEPTALTLLEDPYLNDRHYKTSGGRKTDLAGDIAQAQKSFSPGTAEHIGLAKLAEQLAGQGYTKMYTPALQRESYRSADRYVSAATFEYLLKRNIRTSGNLKEQGKAVAEMSQTIRQTVRELAESGDPIAKQIDSAYAQLRAPGSGKEVATRSRETPLTATIKIANFITPQLNQMEEIQQSSGSTKPMELLDLQDLSSLPIAFERILYAIRPSLLKAAREGPVMDGNVLRLRMVYIDALAQQWSEHNQRRGLNVGSFVINSLANGLKPWQVANDLKKLSEQRPDDNATKTMHGIQHSSDVNARSAHFNRRKPGSGIIS